LWNKSGISFADGSSSIFKRVKKSHCVERSTGPKKDPLCHNVCVTIFLLVIPLIGIAFLGAAAKSEAPGSESRTFRLAVHTDGTAAGSTKNTQGPPKHSYHTDPPAGPLPLTLDPKHFTDKKAFVAYSLAAKLERLLYQEPCYCTCDINQGHKSLLDCYILTHGAACPICQKEVIITYEYSKRGKTAAEIRRAMEQGEAWKFDLDKYVEERYQTLIDVVPKRH
jgi:hypothetical protein